MMFHLLVGKYPNVDLSMPSLGAAVSEACDLAERLRAQHIKSDVYVYTPSSRLAYWTNGIDHRKEGWWE